MSTAETAPAHVLIAAQNDAFRTTLGRAPGILGRIIFTRGGAMLSNDDHAQIARALSGPFAFTPDTDPHKLHDFGAFEIESDGETLKLWWKIDLYSADYAWGAETPEDPEETRRVLTVMLPEEY